MLPNFIIIGAMKAGTSSLFRYISTHQNIEPSSFKETNFFKNDREYNKGIGWYEKLFVKNREYAFEASPSYTKRHLFPGVPSRIHSVLPKAKLIYVLRDPIERIISHYMHKQSHGSEFRSLSEVVKNIKGNYVQTSLYYFQIQAFLEYFSESNILLVESEKLRKMPVDVLVEIFDFLKIHPDYDPAVLEKRFHESEAKTQPSKLERVIAKRTKNPYLRLSARKISKPFRQPIEKPILSKIERERLVEVILPDVEKLRGFSGLEFSNWSF
ncbi:MAG: sulfotransferase domain-containing protein [Leptolyngbyaceae cyanobacterium MAG.088]|nr:sulfotransferase domain-containing protein [Leptolyngbyaceae cyanobacterium MAG.088]